MSTLPEGFTERLARPEEADTVAALMNACDDAFGTGERVTADDVRSSWSGLGETGRATLVLDVQGAPAAYYEVFSGSSERLHLGGEFARRGEKRVGLGVDAESETGATRLYERVGMHVAFQANVFRKDFLR
jgi:hypothetical protein